MHLSILGRWGYSAKGSESGALEQGGLCGRAFLCFLVSFLQNLHAKFPEFVTAVSIHPPFCIWRICHQAKVCVQLVIFAVYNLIIHMHGKLLKFLNRSILSRYGVHGFPTLFLLNSTMRVRYHGARTINSLVAFYNDVTGNLNFFCGLLGYLGWFIKLGKVEEPLKDILKNYFLTSIFF